MHLARKRAKWFYFFEVSVHQVDIVVPVYA